MARDLNKVLLIGNLTADPESRTTATEKSVCGFRIATKRVWTTEKGERKEQTQYHRIVAWGSLGELCTQLLHKGSRVYVEGRIVNSEYEKEGEKRTTTEVVIDDMILLDRKKGEVVAARGEHEEVPEVAGE